MNLILPHIMKEATTPERSAKVMTEAVLNAQGVSGVYFDNHGQPMKGSTEVMTPEFQEEVVRETRALLATV